MAGASDKARFYLEQSVPELQELSRKNIFTPTEITAIAKKRSDFEHILNARGSKPADYVRYATYEMNLDALRKKRCKRLGVKSTTYSGQRTIFFILDRATKKFPGDMGLWMQYVEFCQREKAGKKLARVFTSMLRLKPREWGLWVLAAKHYAETNGDMSSARSYMQRGLRFCKDETRIYLEYAKMEMVYLAKLAARRKILGLDEERTGQEVAGQGDDDMIALPEVTAEDLNPEARKGVEEVDVAALKRLADAPAYTGAIPMAIYDAAMKQFEDDAGVAHDFFDLVATFDTVPSSWFILRHVCLHLERIAEGSPEHIICGARMHTFATPVDSADFPAALGVVLSRIRQGIADLQPAAELSLSKLAVRSLLPYLQSTEDMDEGLVKVLKASLKRYLGVVAQASNGGQKHTALLLSRLRRDGREAQADMLERYLQEMG